jgi:Trk-type K+ transport system membrane component
MNDLIPGIIGVGMLIMFVGGLAISIGSVPFFVIAAIVLLMAIVDFIETLVQNRRQQSSDQV